MLNFSIDLVRRDMTEPGREVGNQRFKAQACSSRGSSSVGNSQRDGLAPELSMARASLARNSEVTLSFIYARQLAK